jgi:hypothetical protein
MKKIISIFLLTLLISNCSSTRIIDQWASEETPVFEANKVLVVGMSADTEIRRMFEEQLVVSLEKNEVTAVRSIDFFPSAFTDESRSETDLNAIEELLVNAGFDAILVSKITGTERKVSVFQAYSDLAADFQNFNDYYYSNQAVYHSKTREQYKIYHSETSVFCICPGVERELLWRGNIDIVDPYNTKRNVNDYVRTLIKALKANELVIVPR